MELQLTVRAPTAATTAFWGCNKCGVSLCDVAGVSMKKKKRRTKIELIKVVRLTTMVERGGGGEAVNGGGAGAEIESSRGGGGGGGGYTSSAMEVTTFNQRLRSAETEFLVWKNIGAFVRLSYGIGIYVTMALAGRFICSMTGIDCTGGFDPSLDSIVEGLGYAAPPIMAILFILDEEVVKSSPHARAIRYVEDEEVRSFYYGMSPWPVMFRYSCCCKLRRGGAFLMCCCSDWCSAAMCPICSNICCVVTATLTGPLYYVAASPKDPTYVVARVLQSCSGREDLKQLFSRLPLYSLDVKFLFLFSI